MQPSLWQPPVELSMQQEMPWRRGPLSQRHLRPMSGCSLNARPARKDAASVFILTKLCSSSCVNVNRPRKDEANCVSGSRARLCCKKEADLSEWEEKVKNVPDPLNFGIYRQNLQNLPGSTLRMVFFSLLRQGGSFSLAHPQNPG